MKSDSIKTSAITDYLNDANNSLFDTPIIGLEIYRSEDAGKTWKKTHTARLKNVVYTYGYYFGRIAVSPIDDNRIAVCGLPLIFSTDGGKSFKPIDGDNVHGDHHAVWMSAKRPGHMIICNDGGLNITYDEGKHWFKANTPPVGQFYHVTVDMETPYNVYGGLQDNGVWTGSSSTTPSAEWHASGSYPYKFLMGGDGMQNAGRLPRQCHPLHRFSIWILLQAEQESTGWRTVDPAAERPGRTQLPFQLANADLPVPP